MTWIVLQGFKTNFKIVPQYFLEDYDNHKRHHKKLFIISTITVNSRYEFEYEVQNGVKPAYRYTVEYEDEEESKIPKLGVIYDEQEVIDIGGSLYFEVKIAEVEEENGIPTLGIVISSMIIICLSIIYKKE